MRMAARSHVSYFSVLMALLFAIKIPWQSVPYNVENTYLIRGWLGNGPLRGDWFMQTHDHLAFSTAVLRTICSENSIWVIRPCTFLLNWISFLLVLTIGMELLPSLQKRGSKEIFGFVHFLVMAGILFQPCLTAIGYLSPDFRDLLNQNLSIRGFGLYGYTIEQSLSPAFVASTLLLGGILAGLRRRASLLAALSGLAVLVHPGFFVSSLILLGAYSATRILDSAGEWKPWFWYACLAGPGMAVALVNLHPSSSLASHRAVEIMVFERIPHHAWPSAWPIFPTFLAGLVVVAALWILRSDLQSFRFLGLAVVFAAAPLVLFWLLGIPELLALLPHRVATALFPCLVAVVTGKSAEKIWQNLAKLNVSASRWGVSIAAALMFVAVVRSAIGFQQQQLKRRPTDEAVWAKGPLPSGTLVVPIEWENFRWLSQHPILVDWKNHPMQPDELIEWRARIDIARGLQLQPEDARIQAEAVKRGATAILLPASKSTKLHLLRRIEGNGMRLYALPNGLVHSPVATEGFSGR